jgi:hypothetical protein
VDVARQQWEEGHRRLQAEPSDRLHEQVEAVTEELRRRIGLTFTLTELVEEYETAERWAAEAVEERAPSPGWTRTVGLATDAAFHLYSRGAQDYVP